MTDWTEKEICIAEIATLLENGYEIEVDSPDGYVSVSSFVYKGMFDEYVLHLENDIQVRCNENHLFETDNGWKFAKDIVNLQKKFLTKDGYVCGNIKRTDNRISIVDITVEHPNHRYYTNNVSSHNTGVGKTLAMCHLAASYLVQGYNVLYITNEMAEERIAERIDANLLNISLDDIESIPQDEYMKRIDKLKIKANGKLIIKEYPTGSASVNHFNALMNDLRLKKKFKPDIVFIDYINLCASSRIKAGPIVGSYMFVKAIAEEVRGFAVVHNVVVWSATQLNRAGFESSDPGLENTAESFGLPATVDFMIVLLTSEELDKLNQIMWKQLKNRYFDLSKLKRFVTGIERSKMRLYNVNTSAQENLIDPDTGSNSSDWLKSKKTVDKSKINEKYKDWVV